MKMSTCIIIPNWNGRELIGETLRSLEGQPADVIVVDNGSTDGSVDYLREKFPKVTVLSEPKNRGFAGGVNVGIRYALSKGYSYIALLNNDAVPESDWIKTLAKAIATRPKAGVVTSKILLTDKQHLDSTGEVYTTRGMPYPRGRHQLDQGQYDDAEEVFAGSGGATLYRAKMLRQVGLFDEDFFAYFEDVDMSFRARLAGWQVWYEPKARVYHRVSATSSRFGHKFSYYHLVKNFVLLYDRNMPTSLYLKYKPWFLYQFARMFAGSVRNGTTGTFLRATARAFWLQPKSIWIHIRRHRQRKVSPHEIEKWLEPGKPPTPPSLETSYGQDSY